MSVDIIPAGDADSTKVKVGEDQHVSMQLLQDIYNEITGKTEKISKGFRLHHQTTFEDICQLDAKITQLYEQYNIVGNNCAITLFYVDEGKEQFSSFDRFRFYDSSALSPVESIRLKYNFLIVLPKTDRPQPYDIEIDIHSRAGMYQRSEFEVGLPKRIIFSLASLRTGLIEIEYIDYTVARNFQVAIEQWFNSLPQAKPIFGIKYLKSYSDYFPSLFKYLSAVVVACFFYANYTNWLPEGTSSLSTLFTAGVLCFSTIFVVAGMAFEFGRIVRDTIDRIQPTSYLKLNRGDDLAIENLKQSNRWNLLQGIGAIAFAVGTSLIAAWLATYLGIGG